MTDLHEFKQRIAGAEDPTELVLRTCYTYCYFVPNEKAIRILFNDAGFDVQVEKAQGRFIKLGTKIESDVLKVVDSEHHWKIYYEFEYPEGQDIARFSLMIDLLIEGPGNAQILSPKGMNYHDFIGQENFHFKFLITNLSINADGVLEGGGHGPKQNGM